VISLRALVVLTLATVVAAITGGLTLAAGASWPAALLSAGGAGGVALELFLRLVEQNKGDP
jgi:hypothetical protein